MKDIWSSAVSGAKGSGSEGMSLELSFQGLNSGFARLMWIEERFKGNVASSLLNTVFSVTVYILASDGLKEGQGLRGKRPVGFQS